MKRGHQHLKILITKVEVVARPAREHNSRWLANTPDRKRTHQTERTNKERQQTMKAILFDRFSMKIYDPP